MHIRAWSTLAAFAVVFAGCTSSSPSVSTHPIPAEWLRVPEAERMRIFAFTPEGHLTTAVLSSAVRRDPAGVEIQTTMLGSRLVKGELPLTDYFAVIDSFDVSPERGEVVFSAKQRDGSLDIGLVSLEGGAVVWVPADAADEIAVKWAPRGNKISYVVRTAGGDVVRTLHIPTSFQLSVPFPHATIHSLRWDAPAERYAVSYSTPDASDRIEVMKYGGEERAIAYPPAQKLDVEIDVLGPDAIALRPRDVQYGERLPLVIWVGETSWNDARAELMRSARVAMVASRTRPDQQLWNAIGELSWIDASSAFIVAPGGAGEVRGTVITADPAVPSGHYRVEGNVIRVTPAVVQSFAAGYIADALKRTSPLNVSNR